MRGVLGPKNQLLWIRERWARVTNEALREAGVAARIDHRSYRNQGIDLEPKPMRPGSNVYGERNSGRSHPAGKDIRARYRERVEAREGCRGARAGRAGGRGIDRMESVVFAMHSIMSRDGYINACKNSLFCQRDSDN
jgi:hypothetical protein